MKYRVYQIILIKYRVSQIIVIKYRESQIIIIKYRESQIIIIKYRVTQNIAMKYRVSQIILIKYRVSVTMLCPALPYRCIFLCTLILSLFTRTWSISPPMYLWVILFSPFGPAVWPGKANIYIRALLFKESASN